MKQYKYVLLDWDGNLANTLDLWLEACRAPLVKRGLHLSDEAIAASFGQFGAYLEGWGIKDVDVVINEMDQFAKKKLPEVELYPDALFVLEQLKNLKIKTALITTSLYENIKHSLDDYSLNEYFDVIVAHEDVEHHKPHPEPIEKALKLLGGTKEQAVMVGDSDKDLGSAKNAGVDSALFFPPEHRKFYDLEKLKEHLPTYIMSDFRKLLEIVAD